MARDVGIDHRCLRAAQAVRSIRGSHTHAEGKLAAANRARCCNDCAHNRVRALADAAADCQQQARRERDPAPCADADGEAQALGAKDSSLKLRVIVLLSALGLGSTT
eukprot:775611-Pleurochrysis_carterae.AAC.2